MSDTQTAVKRSANQLVYFAICLHYLERILSVEFCCNCKRFAAVVSEPISRLRQGQFLRSGPFARRGTAVTTGKMLDPDSKPALFHPATPRHLLNEGEHNVRVAYRPRRRGGEGRVVSMQEPTYKRCAPTRIF